MSTPGDILDEVSRDERLRFVRAALRRDLDSAPIPSAETAEQLVAELTRKTIERVERVRRSP